MLEKRCWRKLLRDGYPIYAPLTHVDLRVIPSWNDGRRARAIVRSISPLSRTVLDIGAHWGYMSEELEKTGRSCTALEVDRKHPAEAVMRDSQAAAAGISCSFQFQGSSVCSWEAGWSAIRRSTSASDACGSTPLSSPSRSGCRLQPLARRHGRSRRTAMRGARERSRAARARPRCSIGRCGRRRERG